MSSAPLVRPEFAAWVRSAGSLAADSDDATRVLPVVDALRPLLPGGGLRRGSTIVVARPTARPATTSMTPDRTPANRVPVVIADGLAPGGLDRASVPPVGLRRSGSARQLDRLENRSGGATLRAAASRAAAARSAPRWGATSIMLALLAEASRAGAWCAVVGLPELGLQAAAELGVALDRLALVPHPNTKWTDVVAALIDGFDVVVTTTSQIDARSANRLSARARQRDCVLIPVGAWDTPDLVLEPVQSEWMGIRPGHGRLKCRHLTVAAQGRGAAARPKQVDVWLPTAAGGIAPYADVVPHLPRAVPDADAGPAEPGGAAVVTLAVPEAVGADSAAGAAVSRIARAVPDADAGPAEPGGAAVVTLAVPDAVGADSAAGATVSHIPHVVPDAVGADSAAGATVSHIPHVVPDAVGTDSAAGAADGAAEGGAPDVPHLRVIRG